MRPITEHHLHPSMIHIAGVLCLVSSLAGILAGCVQNPTSDAEPRISVSSTEQHLGNLNQTGAATTQFTIANTGSGTLRILNVLCV